MGSLGGGTERSRCHAGDHRLPAVDDDGRSSYDELVERRERLTRALAALDGGTGTKKRVRWEQIAEYVAQHPAAMPAEIAAVLEIPAANAHAHLGRNEGTVFERRIDGWHVIEGWEALRRGEDDG